MATREKIKEGWNKFKEKAKYNLANPTEFTKAQDEFEKLMHAESTGINSNGYVSNILVQDIAQEISERGSYEFFNKLNKIGVRVKKSGRTRNTSHKGNDFSSLQADSSNNIETFYSKMLKEIAKNEDPVDLGDAIYDEKYTKTIADFNKKAQKELDSLIKLINGNKIMKQAVEGKIEEIKNNKSKLKELEPHLKDMCSQIGDGAVFVDKNNKRIKDNLDGFGECLVGGAYLGTPYYLTFFVEGAAIGFPPLLLVGSGIMLAIALAAVVWAVLELGLAERIGTIKAKRYLIKVKEKVRNITKYTNDITRYNRQYVRDLNRKGGQQEIEVTEGLKDIIEEFVEKQKRLWEPYTTVEGRQYKEEMKRAHGKHVSGIRIVRDDKASTEMGSLKLAFANTWCKIRLL